MRKALVGVIISYLLITASAAWGQDAMQLFNLGLNSTITTRKIDYFTRALELDPKLYAAYEKRGMLYYFQGKYTETIQDFRKAAEQRPSESKAYLMMGLAQIKKGNFDAAHINLTRAIELDPQGADAYSHRAEVYFEKGMIEQAIQDASMTIKLGGDEPILGKAYTVRGKAYRELGRSEQADEDFKKALNLDPEYYIYTIASPTGLLAESASKSSLPQRIGWMGGALLVALLFVVIFKLTFSAPQKDDDDYTTPP
jgi:tetratricopeptide (TPR) repeat protein